ncbi:hypothetical protein [Helicobacter pylori]|nr:hypothetical protein [Helicobacter pylori]UOR67133.1 hypothetical protein MPG15_04040 [Helicobacter pylori]UOR68577.1 hypothetical protein MPG40_03850 [Helicobacter pylori]
MHQNDKTFLPTPSAHLSKIILFLNAGFLAYVLYHLMSSQYYDMLLVNH